MPNLYLSAWRGLWGKFPAPAWEDGHGQEDNKKPRPLCIVGVKHHRELLDVMYLF